MIPIHTYRDDAGRKPAVRCAILSPRELEVLQLLAQGYTAKEVAKDLGVALKTVEKFIINLYNKTGAKNKIEAVGGGVRSGLIPMETLPEYTRLVLPPKVRKNVA